MKRRIETDEWYDMIEKIATVIKLRKEPYIFGVPRGGTAMSVLLCEKTGKKLTSMLIEGETIVVDDLIDSGRTMEKYKGYPFMVLIDKRKEYKNEWIEFWYEETQKDEEDIVVRMLETIGENPNRLGLKDTPKRVVKMWKELFRGYDESQKPKLTVFENGDDGIVYDEMIIDTGDFYSQCEHHMVPFFGQYYFAYIPDKKILGISKVARLVDHYSAKLQVQERLVKEILDEIEKDLSPKGIALVMKGEHLCKTMRGVKKKGQMITSDLRGVFKTNPEARSEFMGLIK